MANATEEKTEQKQQPQAEKPRALQSNAADAAEWVSEVTRSMLMEIYQRNGLVDDKTRKWRNPREIGMSGLNGARSELQKKIADLMASASGSGASVMFVRNIVDRFVIVHFSSALNHVDAAIEELKAVYAGEKKD